MKWSWFFLLMVAIVVGWLTYGVTGRFSCPLPDDGLERLSEISFLVRELGLDEEQIREIKIIHDAWAFEVRDCRVRHCTARTRLGQSLTAEGEVSENVESVLNEMCQAYRESEMATLQTIVRVRELLDHKQRERFDQLVVNCTVCKCADRVGSVSAANCENGGWM